MFVNTEVAFKEIEISKTNAQKSHGFNNGSISQRSTGHTGGVSMVEKEMMLHVAGSSHIESPSTITPTTETSPMESNKLLLQLPTNQTEKIESELSPSQNGTSSASSSMDDDHHHEVVV